MLKYTSIKIKPKKKKSLVTVVFQKTEIGKKKEHVWDAKWTKQSNQPMSKALQDAVDRLTPHLMYASELADGTINLDGEMNYDKWFKELHWKDDSRFDGLQLTEVRFIGTDLLQAIKLFGYRETQRTDKAFKVKIETPVINIDRLPENHYALNTIADDQTEDLLAAIDGWLEKGETQAVIEFDEVESN